MQVKLVNGALQVKLSASWATVLLDVSGHYSTGSGAAFKAVSTARVFTDTVGTTAVVVPITRHGGVPVDASAVLVNAEVYNPSVAGYVRVTPAGVAGTCQSA